MARTINDSVGIVSVDGEKITNVKNPNQYTDIQKDSSVLKESASSSGTVKPFSVDGKIAPSTRSTANSTTENSYGDIAGNKEGYSPNSEGLSNTGSGAEAAVGTDYSWNKQGSGQAQATYTNDVLTAKQNLLNNRQTAENNAVNYQAQADMMKYQNNQNAEKVGWTGGYVLDQNRQMDYLKASIQAQMYGAMELQKYGYDSSLAAARLSYDLNQQEYARQYYQEAVSAALSEAQLTGTYFSAETKDMMSQLAVAQQKKNDQSLSQEERDQAAKLEKQIEDWFSTNGISKEGVKTLEAWQQDQANELQWSNELWTRYQAAIEAANTNIADNPSNFIMLDANGKEIWDGTNITTGNWETMEGKDILDYIKGNASAMNQYYSYLDSTITGQVETGFAKWCQTNGYISTDENGNTVVKNKNFQSALVKYIGQSGVIEQFTKKFADLNENEVYEMISNWDFTIQLPDGTTVTKTYAELSQESAGASSGSSGETTTSTGSSTSTSGETVNYTWSVTSGTTERTGYNTSNYYKTSLTQGNLSGKQICVTTASVVGVDSPGHSQEDNLDSDDIGIKIFEDDSGDVKGGYETEVDDTTHSIIWKPGTAEGDEIAALIKEQTGEPVKAGTIIVVNGKAYFYNQAGNKPYAKLSSGWILIGGQCGKSTFQSALKESGQWVD